MSFAKMEFAQTQDAQNKDNLILIYIFMCLFLLNKLQ